MKTINLIPMAGKGSRFRQNHYNVPKPFVDVLGQPAILRALSSLPASDQTVLVCLEEHRTRYSIDSRIQRTLPDMTSSINMSSIEMITAPDVTEGQACTCLLATPFMSPDDTLLIASCDYQAVYDQDRYLALLNDPDVDVIIWTFSLRDLTVKSPDAFAYCRVDPATGRVTEVVEKRTISATPERDPAVVGTFTFKRAADFIHAAESMIQRNIRVNGEFYVGTSINQLIEQGKSVVIFEVDQFISFGDPFELQLMEYWESFFNGLPDHPYRR